MSHPFLHSQGSPARCPFEVFHRQHTYLNSCDRFSLIGHNYRFKCNSWENHRDPCPSFPSSPCNAPSQPGSGPQSPLFLKHPDSFTEKSEEVAGTGRVAAGKLEQGRAWVSVRPTVFLCLHGLHGELNTRVPALITACQDKGKSHRRITPRGHLESRTFGVNARGPRAFVLAAGTLAVFLKGPLQQNAQGRPTLSPWQVPSPTAVLASSGRGFGVGSVLPCLLTCVYLTCV